MDGRLKATGNQLVFVIRPALNTTLEAKAALPYTVNTLVVGLVAKCMRGFVDCVGVRSVRRFLCGGWQPRGSGKGCGEVLVMHGLPVSVNCLECAAGIRCIRFLQLCSQARL